MKKSLESLSLDDAQKEKIKPILEQLKTDMKDKASQMKDLSMQMKQQMTSDNADASSTETLIDQKTKLIGDMMKAKAAAKSQIIALLTPEQKAKLRDRILKNEEKKQDMYKDCHEEE